MIATAALSLCIIALLAAVVYLLDSLYGRRLMPIKQKVALAYIAAAILVGIFGEVLVETIYNAIVGEPLWYYQVLPVHNAYTSILSLALWAMYGLHLYWVQVAIDERFGKIAKWKLVSIFAIESLLLETFANLVWLLVFGKLIYFYTPSDLWHVTTLVNIPCYFAAAWVMIGAVKRFRHDPRAFFIMSLLILLVFLFFV